MNYNVTILSFSPRNDGNCNKISEFIADFHMRTNVHSFEITAKNCVPCHSCNYECLTPGENCPVVDNFQRSVMDSIMDSQIVYYIVPNFCGYPNGNYFAFNERSVGYFNMDRNKMQQYMAIQKKFIIVSNTESDNFKNAMQQQTSTTPDILYLKTGKYKKRSTAGDLLESEEAKSDLMEFLIRDNTL